MHTLPLRSKLGPGKQFKFASRGARKLLSVLFIAGICFFAILSFSTFVQDPGDPTVGGPVRAGSRLRRVLHGGRGADIPRTVSQGTGTAAAPAALRLMLATHNRLFWYYPATNETVVLHEGGGVHYGVFPGQHNPNGELKTVWNVVRPHNWHPTTSEEFLVEIDVQSGKEITRKRLHTRFTHDATRRGDRVYVANTEAGEVQELSFPAMQLLRSMKLFTKRQHVNTLAPLSGTDLWVVLHNLGKSDAVRIDLSAEQPQVAATVKAVGLKAHGLVEWGKFFVMLDSENAALVIVDPVSGEVHRRWQAPDHAAQPKFLKGLCVIDDVAYFGVNVWGERQTRDSATHDGELAAVELKGGRLVWRRSVPTHGLLNLVAAPHLGEASTYRAMTSAAAAAASQAANGQAHSTGAELGSGGLDASRTLIAASSGDAGAVKGGSGIDDPRVKEATAKLVGLGFPPKYGGHWASGQPFLDLKAKTSANSPSAGISLPLMQLDISKLRAKVLSMPEDMWDKGQQRKDNAAVDGRADNMAKFKPGVEALFMVFSDQSTEHVYRFPYYDYFKDEVEALVETIIGRADMNKIVRMQFARMKPGTTIKAHKDMGGYAKVGHRIHVPIVTHPNVTFEVCPADDQSQRQKSAAGLQGGCVQIPMAEGMVFELNNRVTHQVLNRSPVKRVQLVVDVAETPRVPRLLKRGAVCNYVTAVMECPPEVIAGPVSFA